MLSGMVSEISTPLESFGTTDSPLCPRESDLRYEMTLVEIAEREHDAQPVFMSVRNPEFERRQRAHWIEGFVAGAIWGESNLTKDERLSPYELAQPAKAAYKALKQKTLDNIGAETDQFRAWTSGFCDGGVYHYRSIGGKVKPIGMMRAEGD